jgi:hypothetical protein
MTENPNGDFTRAEDTVLNLSDHFAAKANTKSVYGEPIHVGSRTIVPVAKVGICWELLLADETAKLLEAVAEGVEF